VVVTGRASSERTAALDVIRTCTCSAVMLWVKRDWYKCVGARSRVDAGMRAAESGRGRHRLKKWLAAEESGEVLGHLVVGVLWSVVERG